MPVVEELRGVWCAIGSRGTDIGPRSLRDALTSGSRPNRQPADRRGARLVCLDQIVLRLKVDPELRIGTEPVAEAERGVAGDRALAGDDLADAVGRHGDLARERGRGDPEFFQLVLEDFAGMDGSREHWRFSGPRMSCHRRQAAIRFDGRACMK